MTTYRRKRGDTYQEWHYSRRCTSYPQEDYEIAYSEPHVGRICQHCQRLEKKTKVKQW